MIKRFKIHNFKSIIDIDLDFSYNERKPNGYNPKENEEIYYYQANSKNKLIPVGAFFGANASGKTNILNAMTSLKQILVFDDIKLFNPYRLNDIENKNTIFELELIIDKKDCIYTIEYNEEQIVREKFVVNNETIFKTENGKINNKELEEKFKLSCINNNKQNITFLKILSQNYQNFIKEATNFYNFIVRKIKIFYTNQFPNSVSVEQCGFEEIIDILCKLDNKIVKAEYIKQDEEELINKIENKIFKFEIHRRKDDEVKTFHQNTNGDEIEFNLTEESLGTRTLFSLLGFWLKALKEGEVIFFDEIEKSLHPLLIKSLIKMFKTTQCNSQKSQLFFTTHCIEIMNKLRKTEIYIFNNTTKTGTTIQRLNKIDGVRNITDFSKQYMNGEYGGIPYITL